MTNSSNLYRKVRSLVAKVVANGCTAHEHVAVTNLAVSIIAKHGLDAARIDWPAPPAGFAWTGEPGRAEIIEKPVERKTGAKHDAKPATAKSEPEGKAKKPRRPIVGERLLAMLQRPNGATLEEITGAFGILPHSARAIISIEIRKKRRLKVTLDRQTGRYSIAG